MLTALITGASTGIGLATALHFARQGYRVFAGVRKPQVMTQYPNVVPVRLDVDQDTSLRECAARVLAEAGAIDVLVNNTGIGQIDAVEMVPRETVRQLFETNFFGAVRMIQAVLPAMRERRKGTVVNVTSMLGHMTLGCHGFYAATKFALAALSEALDQAVRGQSCGRRARRRSNADLDQGREVDARRSSLPAGDAEAVRVIPRPERGRDHADVVARLTYEAVSEGASKLRYPVGADAEVMAAARDRMSAAEWAALLTEEDEEQFLAGAEKAFGVDLYHPPSLHAQRAGSPG